VEIAVPTIRRPWGRMAARIRDLESRMPTWHSFRSNQIVTWAHETTHGLNSRIRNSLRSPRTNAFYIYDGVAITATEPDFHITDFAANVPWNLRGRIYKMYVNNRSWNDRPLYLFDEWCAYQNGSIVALEEKVASRDDSLESCLEMCVYCAYILEGAHKGGVAVKPAADVYEAYDKLLLRMHKLFQDYKGKVSASVRDRINYYAEQINGSAVVPYLEANGLSADSFVL